MLSARFAILSSADPNVLSNMFVRFPIDALFSDILSPTVWKIASVDVLMHVSQYQ